MENIIYEQLADQIGAIYFAKNEFSKEERAANVKPHFHDAIEIKFVTNGSYSLMIGGIEKTLTAGKLIFIEPNKMHYNISTANSEYYTLRFNSIFLYNVCGKNKIFSDVISADNHLFSVLEEMFQNTFASWERMDNEKRKGFVYRFIGTVAQFYSTIEFKASESENEIGKILKYIQDKYQEEITLQSVSKKFGYAPSYFSALFKKNVGVNFKSYVNRLRIDVACKIIAENKNMPLWVIAEKVGYKSFVTFYRSYKKYANVANEESR